VKPESKGQSGRWQSEYHDVMIDHDKNVGAVLKALDDAGIADNTFVMYSTDNGPNMFSWPDGAMTPFRNEKNTNWEGAYRAPCVVRWPGKIKPDTVSNEIVAHHDWLPTFVAMAGDPEVRTRRRRRLRNTRFPAVRYRLTGAGLSPAGSRQLRLTHRNRKFESISLQERVRCEPHSDCVKSRIERIPVRRMTIEAAIFVDDEDRG
jgi:arylsulfatase A-like enzyme